MLLEHLNVDRIITDDVKDLRLSFIDERRQTPILDMHWTYQHALKSMPLDEDSTWSHHRPEDIRSNIHYLSDWRIDVAAHVGEPFSLQLPEALTTFMRTSTGHTHSAANAIVSLWLTSGTDQPVEQLVALYTVCATFAETCSWPPEERDIFVNLITRQLIIDDQKLPVDWRLEMQERLLSVDSSTQAASPGEPFSP